MSRKRWLLLGGGVLALGFVFVLVGSLFYFERLPEHLSQHETIVLGQSQLVPGSTAAMRVAVRDSRDAEPLAGAGVKVLMRPAEGGQALSVYEGTTDATGTLDVSFSVPEDAEPDQVLVVETVSSLGSDRMEKPVTLTRDHRLLVTTDKPLYQPAQIIHIRVLGLGAFDHRPAVDQRVELAVADGKGNTVFRKSLTTTSFGVASVDFQLAESVNTGPYKITATLGNTSSEKTVTVEHYTLPNFEVALSSDRDYYRPGDRVEGTLSARYFFGKDVTQSAVVIEGYTFDFERVVSVAIDGQTDDLGQFEFAFDLPDYLAGTEFEDGRARFYVEARVTDQAEHTEVGRLSLPVAQQALVIDAIPEGGTFRVGVENILYILTSTPDGAPAESEITVTVYDSNETLVAQTGPYGLAEVRFTPQSTYVTLRIQAQDTTGALADREFWFEGPYDEESVLLRPDAPIYRVGDTMALTILTSQSTGTVYLDIVREGQTVSTRAVDVSAGRAEISVDLDPALYGTLELHAYKILRSGHIVRDTRLVVVDQAADLSVGLQAGADTYRPGEDAVLDVSVTDPAGTGVQAALGLAIVDEAVFALAEQDPGFAKLYFMLEEELLAPKFELHGFSIPEMISDPCPRSGDDACTPPVLEAQADAGKAALASAISAADPFTLEANSHEQAMARAYDRQRAFYRTLATGSFGLFLVLPLAVLVLNGIAVIRRRHFWKSLGLALGILILTALSLLGALWLVDELFWRLQELLVTLLAVSGGLLALIGLVTLTVTAVHRKDGLLGSALILISLSIPVGILLGWSVNRGLVMPDGWLILVGALAALLLPVSLLLRGAGFAWERRAWPALGAWGLGLPVLSGLVVILGLGGFGTLSPGVMMQAAGGDEVWMIEPAAAPMAEMGVRNLDTDGVVLEVETVVGKEEATAGDTVSQGAEPPRLRQYFPETMLWLPEEVTDVEGRLMVEFPVADSITTWRVVALASSQDGRLGSAAGELRVFQDFFIDLDLPGSLTVGDEIAVPVGIFNYLPEAQTVRLEVTRSDWFELIDEPVKEISIASNDITVVYFRVRALEFGQQPFQVTAYGSQMSDAIRKDVRVFPDGKQLRFAVSDKLDPTVQPVETIRIPSDAIAGTQNLTVKIYPGVVSQVVEGLDALLRMPFGCFEQTSSATYPNVLVLDYLKTSGQVSPEVQMKAEQYINLGYQRLTTFEVSGEPGGFSLFGDSPADPMLTAYGLQEFGDMSRVYEIDPALIRRIADWLFARQNSDGSWEGVAGFHETNITNLTGRIPVTAFIVWGLADAGYADDGRTQTGAAFLRDQISQVETAYDLSLVANALVAVDIKVGGITDATDAVLSRLAGMAKRDGDAVSWEPGRETYMGGSGVSGGLETTASVALACLRAERHTDLANEALVFLTRNKDSFGTWETTSATVMALKALIESVRSGAEDVDADVTVRLNGGEVKTVQVTQETFDVVQVITFDDVPVGRDAMVEILMTGKGNLMYQVTGSYYLPWDRLSFYPELVSADELVSIDVAYDRTELAVNDTVGVDVTVTLNEYDGVAEQTIIDLGLPPGFEVETDDLARLVARFRDLPDDYPHAQVKRFELTGRQIILYVRNLNGTEPLTLSYRLRAKFPLVAQTPASTAYDYYNPGASADAAPQMLTVVGE